MNVALDRIEVAPSLLRATPPQETGSLTQGPEIAAPPPPAPEVVSGVPPDAFSETGQYWGNPLYRWDVLRSRGYDWWIQRMSWALRLCDLIRLDHFRGFESYWEIPAHEKTAVHGRWVKGPADDLFQALRNALGDRQASGFLQVGQ